MKNIPTQNQEVKASKAKQAEAYWAAIPDNSERTATYVAKKFKLKFATYILSGEVGREEQIKIMLADGYAVLRGVKMSHGPTADLIFN